MNTKEQKIWVKLRAESIKHFHDTRNAGKFVNGFSMEHARKIAEAELEQGLQNGKPIISLQELLTNTDEQNSQTVNERLLSGLKTKRNGEVWN